MLCGAFDEFEMLKGAGGQGVVVDKILTLLESRQQELKKLQQEVDQKNDAAKTKKREMEKQREKMKQEDVAHDMQLRRR